ncbi:MAG TPA: dsDNA nuclease domain-containing protein [Amaricoccus sp.]|uniref:dsDNA nuclease domain-containing protein n=1 Tax=Amaricoccus sp. TaxID=1872485 RepID=UPI002C169AD1|nr:dsDNA nuclease domain-containing protein [Amaricoccus sp.]HMR54770.1 dsDNA nuclease domain-containing protein [Amaricoccus sp.]HMU01465.1 dsDNA nuclease domain-containing protein [Amaricoccus sp.]
MTSPDAVLDKSDPGDDVAARFDYQHSYAAINAIRLITGEGNIDEVICENHEDYLLKNRTGKFIGTQIKTRRITLQPFKAGESQVTNALGKFCLLDQKFPGCFEGFDFTTNHAFWENEQSLSNLPWLLATLRQRGDIKGLRENNPLRQFVEGIAASTGLSPRDVAATLLRTSARGHESEITHIRSNVQEALCECPGVKDLPYATVAAIAKAVIQLARDASAKTLRGPITELFAPGTDLKQAVDDQRLAGKRICKADVLAVIDQFKGGSKPYQDIDVTTLVTPADAPSDLVVAFRKLAKGGVEAARVTNIEDRVRSFEALFIEWSRKYGADEAKKRYNNVLAAVQFEAAEAHASAEKGAEPYGSTMYGTLAERLMARARDDRDQLHGCRPEHLIGAAGVLTQQCKTWWSRHFDVAEDAP